MFKTELETEMYGDNRQKTDIIGTETGSHIPWEAFPQTQNVRLLLNFFAHDN